MKYLLMIYCDESVWAREDREAYKAKSIALCHELAREGKYIDAAPLQSVATAKTLRVREGRTVVTDGPFAETKEQLGGYFLIDVMDEAAALAVAARIETNRVGSVEVRPLEPLTGMPG
jgi:hypothetical protein